MTVFTSTFHCRDHGAIAVSLRHGDLVRCPYCAIEAKRRELQRAEDRLAERERAALLGEDTTPGGAA